MTETSSGTLVRACPCGWGQTYGDCCHRFHQGAATPPIAEALMRSRFSAFALADVPYLQRTWHPRTRPRRLALDAAQRWTTLVVTSTSGGNVFDTEGTVTFEAHYLADGEPGLMRECSTFVREAGAWLYVGPVTTAAPR